MKTKAVESLHKDREKLVREVFQRRADGQQQKAMAKALGLQPWQVSDILHRKTDADITIGHDILMKVQDRYPRRKPRKSKGAEPAQKAPPPIAELLVSYTTATHNMLGARQACIDAGVTEDVMKLLRTALEEAL